jgi:predicted NAD-dependent protein-ADP-ribosyltransferase YbiA (DUF1768 family)
MTGLENPHDSILPEIETALVPINSTAWKTAQHFSYGARVLFARPSERSERLKLFVVPLQCNWLCQPLGQQRNKADETDWPEQRHEEYNAK